MIPMTTFIPSVARTVGRRDQADAEHKKFQHQEGQEGSEYPGPV
jgi:hypothetical protein